MSYEAKGKVRKCSICDSDQHVIDENEKVFFLGCGHELLKEIEPALDLGTELETEHLEIPEY